MRKGKKWWLLLFFRALDRQFWGNFRISGYCKKHKKIETHDEHKSGILYPHKPNGISVYASIFLPSFFPSTSRPFFFSLASWPLASSPPPFFSFATSATFGGGLRGSGGLQGATRPRHRLQPPRPPYYYYYRDTGPLPFLHSA